MISFAFLMIFPYLFSVFTYVIFTYGNLGENNWWVFLGMSIIMIMLFVVNYVITLIFIIFKWNSKKALFNSLLIKISYIPVHYVLLLLTGGLLNPFLMILVPIPMILNIVFMGITGTVFVVSRIRFYLRTRKKLLKTIIYSILSYFYIFDIIVAIIGYFEARKYEKELLGRD